MASPEAPPTGLPGRNTLERYTIGAMFGEKWVDPEVVKRVRDRQGDYTSAINAAAPPLPPDPRRTRVALALRGKVLQDRDAGKLQSLGQWICTKLGCFRGGTMRRARRRRRSKRRRHRRSSRR
jgi:hypothetical protein